ncbi:MAG: hypothetical protein ACK55I_23715, partial [bacterium]
MEHGLVRAAFGGFVVDDHAAAEQGFDQFLRRIPAHEPGEGQLERVVRARLFHGDALMRDGGPAHAQRACGDAHAHAAEEVVDPAFLQQGHLDV